VDRDQRLGNREQGTGNRGQGSAFSCQFSVAGGRGIVVFWVGRLAQSLWRQAKKWVRKHGLWAKEMEGEGFWRVKLWSSALEFCRGFRIYAEQNMKMRFFLSVFWLDFADFFVNLSTLNTGIRDQGSGTRD
jgi:hypothetical protein